MSEVEKLPQLLKEINWSVGSDCVFYHFAWSGSERLADGSIQEQFNNVTYSSKTLVIAKKIGCIKFRRRDMMQRKKLLLRNVISFQVLENKLVLMKVLDLPCL